MLSNNFEVPENMIYAHHTTVNQTVCVCILLYVCTHTSHTHTLTCIQRLSSLQTKKRQNPWEKFSRSLSAKKNK